MSDARPAKIAARKPAAKRPPKPKLVRGEPIVLRVLGATIDELARSGYKALRVEEIARTAGVNQTTVYRRWPEKSALVRDALWTFTGDEVIAPATGSLRGDLLALGRTMVEITSAPKGLCVMRMLVAEGSDPEVAALKRSMRARHEAIPRDVVAAAEHRGELSQDVDHAVLFEAFIGAIHHQLYFLNGAVDGAFLERLVDLLLHGALRGAPKGKPPKAPARRR